MKTIFEGEVNGVKFNNVNDYNLALTKAMKEGQVVTANSSTKVVADHEYQPTGRETVATTTMDMFPEFNLDNFTGEEKMDETLISDFLKGSISKKDVIIDVLKSSPEEDRDGVISDYTKILANLIKQSQETKEAKDSLNRQWAILKRSDYILDYEMDFYSNIIKEVTGKDPKPEEVKEPEPEVDLLDGYKRLLKAIFE